MALSWALAKYFVRIGDKDIKATFTVFAIDIKVEE